MQSVGVFHRRKNFPTEVSEVSEGSEGSFPCWRAWLWETNTLGQVCVVRDWEDTVWLKIRAWILGFKRVFHQPSNLKRLIRGGYEQEKHRGVTAQLLSTAQRWWFDRNHFCRASSARSTPSYSVLQYRSLKLTHQYCRLGCHGVCKKHCVFHATRA